ncbi:MAG: hypothetical protein HON47_04345 [Candidatus Diapherotrites archaeon]|uniref:Uncharacterized protein n=1 Tax=Candidatus Iainarchaeum sp. TaxID=3101447 RepID=A0A8T5GFQ1_9ARCH|nr:hypothetical protein [Candidatus Diapherotrites archaeon]MBT7240996.1 hypothetical protein [Candidatus Diapherotrites archaeon]
MQIVMAWLVIVFVIMWVLGGACTGLFIHPRDVSSTCTLQSGLSGLRDVPVIGLLLPYNEWVSIMYWFAPIAGMVIGYFFIRWWNNHFETKEAISIIFLIIMLAVLFGGFFINLMWYYGEWANSASGSTEILECTSGQTIQSVKQYSLHTCFVEATTGECNNTTNMINQQNYANAQRNCSDTLPLVISVKYWPELRESFFLTFVLGILAVWLPLFAFEQLEKKKKKKEN